MIRARARVDLERLVAGFLPQRKTIIATPDGDYPYRLVVTRPQAQTILRRIVGQIDYPNFKEEVARHDRDAAELRSDTYGAVWSELRALESLNDLTIVDQVSAVEERRA